MQIQVELYSEGQHKVCWLDTCCEAHLKPECRMFVGDDLKVWTIIRTLLPLADGVELPPKARKETYCLLDEEGQYDVKAAYPKVAVIDTKRDSV